MWGIAGFVGEFIPGLMNPVIPFQKFLLVLGQKECFPDLVLLKQRFIGLLKRTSHSLANTSPVLSIMPWGGSWVGPYILLRSNRVICTL